MTALGSIVLALWGLFVCGAPLGLTALHGAKRPWSLVLVSTFGVSTGLLFVVTLTLGLCPALTLHLPSVLIVSLLPFVAGCALLVRGRKYSCVRCARGPGSVRELLYQSAHYVKSRLPGTPLRRVIAAVIVLGIAVRLLNCFDKPFVDWDVLARYALNAKRIYESGAISASVTGYPLLIPLAYVYAHLVAGGIDQHLAKVIPFLFSVLSIVATWAFARVVFNERTAWLAAFLMVVTPLHGDRSCSGHVDIPSSFFFLLAAMFCYLLWREGGLRQGVAAGFFIGCAISTKQAGFTLFLSTAAYLLLSWLCDWWTNSVHRKLRIWHVIVPIMSGAVLGLPWYLRNLSLGGNLFPVPSRWWLESARPSYDNLLWLYVVYLGFAVHGLLWARACGRDRSARTLAIGAALVSAVLTWGALTRSRPGLVDSVVIGVGLAISLFPLTKVALQGYSLAGNGVLLLLSFIIPYYAIWWYRYSYDTRFLLEILPFIVVILAHLFDRLCRFLPSRGRAQNAALAVMICVAALPGLVVALGIETPRHLLFGPVGDDEKRLEALGPSYRTVLFLNRRLAVQETAGRICITGDGRMLYFFEGSQAALCLPTSARELEGYRYVVTSPWTAREWIFYSDPRARFIASLPYDECCSEIFSSDGFSVYEVERTASRSHMLPL